VPLGLMRDQNDGTCATDPLYAQGFDGSMTYIVGSKPLYPSVADASDKETWKLIIYLSVSVTRSPDHNVMRR
jgi:hypothetical protein